jgi:hypothetical protein
VFTGLGWFRTHAEAVAYFRSKPRNGDAVVMQDTDLGYGIERIIRDEAGNRLAC